MPNQNRLRDTRERAGLSQAALAARAGISRQAVGAVEGGRHAPSVDTALRLVRAVGATVEEVFGEAPSPVPAGGLADGTSVAVARVGDRAVAHPLAGLVAGDTAWATPDGVVEDGVVRLLPGADPEGLVVVGCDPVLGLCEALIGRQGPRRVVAVAGTSGSAVAALEDGTAHAGIAESVAHARILTTRQDAGSTCSGAGEAPGGRRRTGPPALRRVPDLTLRSR